MQCITFNSPCWNGEQIFDKLIELFVKSWPVEPELHPSLDASSLSRCCRQSHEILLNKGMKYRDSGLNESCSRTFIATVHIAAAIRWRRSGKERTGQTQFSTKFVNKLFVNKLSFMPPWSPVYSCFLFFEISSPMWPNRGFRWPLGLTLRITLISKEEERLGPPGLPYLQWTFWKWINYQLGSPFQIPAHMWGASLFAFLRNTMLLCPQLLIPPFTKGCMSQPWLYSMKDLMTNFQKGNSNGKGLPS
jgi:hypothetical protein